MSGISEKKEKALNVLRDQIDAIDDKLLHLLIERVGVVERVGEIKNLKHSRESIIRPGREAAMIRRVAKEAKGKLPESVVALMWRLIISSAINIEEKSAVSAMAGFDNEEGYWMAREYFGAFTPTTKRPTTMEVVKDVIDGEATIGVLPVSDAGNTPKPWWSRLVEAEDAPKVFTKLPFVKFAPSDRSAMFAIGYIRPESSGDDKSLWVFCTEDTISINTVNSLVETLITHDFELLEHYTQVGSPSQRYLLFELSGFYGEEDESIQAVVTALRKQASTSTTSAYFLGAYATQLDLQT
jgi:chorismate mutase-like protein